jgi:lipopolysaccharide export system protein LptA
MPEKEKILRCIGLLFVCVWLFNSKLFAQNERIELVHANVLEYDQSTTGKIKRLIGDVQFKQGNTLLYCDSAYQFEEQNTVDAYSNVRINHNDSIQFYSKKLSYNANTRFAQLQGDVVMTDKTMRLTTDALTFNMSENTGYYTTGGTIVNEQNTLTSRNGYYYANLKELFFKDDVVLVNKKYKILTDTLRYATRTSVAYFFGPTHITGNNSKLYCERGRFNTKTEVAHFGKNARIQNEDNLLCADSIYYENNNDFGKAWYNIELYDNKSKTILYGDYGTMLGKQKRNFLHGRAAMKKYMEKDSMYLFADTIYSFGKIQVADSVVQHELVKAFRQVSVLKYDMQARCDSVIYQSKDSSLTLFHKPALWSGLNQATADTIIMYMNNNNRDSFRLIENGMMISRIAAKEFDQIKGRIMSGRLSDSKFEYLKVMGNAQSIYYVKEDSAYTGVNVIDCSEMEFFFTDNKISRCQFLTKPDANYYPVKDIKPEELRLKGFKWRAKERPQWSRLLAYYVKKN